MGRLSMIPFRMVMIASVATVAIGMATLARADSPTATLFDGRKIPLPAHWLAVPHLLDELPDDSISATAYGDSSSGVFALIQHRARRGASVDRVHAKLRDQLVERGLKVTADTSNRFELSNGPLNGLGLLGTTDTMLWCVTCVWSQRAPARSRNACEQLLSAIEGQP